MGASDTYMTRAHIIEIEFTLLRKKGIIFAFRSLAPQKRAAVDLVDVSGATFIFIFQQNPLRLAELAQQAQGGGERGAILNFL